ncbi:Uncharacterized protein dnm_068370 [Desulfonema magnum]|uniref:Uncharacterized protein n=1 Tax=Desulfonema magnum TaxID=45655 RepID=A0A975GR88_9BACT|nr:Uncharacterized protein dnm_068370 [Desulfonema magnum]
MPGGIFVANHAGNVPLLRGTCKPVAASKPNLRACSALPLNPLQSNIVRHDFCIAGRKCPAFPHFGEIVSEKRPADISGFQFSGYMNSVSYKCMQKSCRTVLVTIRKIVIK